MDSGNHSSSSSSSSSSMFAFGETAVSETSMMMMIREFSGGSAAVATGGGYPCFSNEDDKVKIMAHPQFHRLLSAYTNCHKIGAPPEVLEKLEEVTAGMMGRGRGRGMCCSDPALDQFMEAYCEMLMKYEEELTKPLKEAMEFCSSMESQLSSLNLSGEIEANLLPDPGVRLIDPQAEEKELKNQLLQKYSGCLGSLKQEFMKKTKKEKLPRDARQQLLNWWSRHYKWPYPSESQKFALSESTGLDQKQINNWFINQRKRHWRPSEEMQYAVMEAAQNGYTAADDVLVAGDTFPGMI